MTTEKTEQACESEEQGSGFGCCSPQKMTEMMAKCGPEMKNRCSAMMQEFMQKGCCQPEQK